MVSSISSSQLLAQQAALKALQGSDSSSTSTGSSATTTAANSATSSLLSALDGSSSTDSTSSYSSLADLFSSSSDDDSDDDASIFASLIAQVKQQIASLQGTTSSDGTTGTSGTATSGSTDDISSSAYMSTLKQKIEALQASPDTKDMGDSMMKALDNGTLTVTDASSGEQITAWDPDNSDATTSTATSIDQTDWSSYLKEHLARDSDGRYSRNADDSQVDKVTGDSSYFGMINDNYYYLSWSGASSDSTATTAAATTSTDT